MLGSRIVAVGVFGFALMAFGIFVREYNSFYAGAGMAPRDYVLSDGAFAARPLGLQSVAREVERCFAAAGGLGSRVLRREVRVRGYQTCLAVADAVLLGTPAHGGALQLRAEMQLGLMQLGGDSFLGGPGAGAEGGAEMGAEAGAGSGLSSVAAAQALAALAAPNTIWLMQRRLLVALQLAEGGYALPPAIAAMVAQDMPKLLGTAATREWLAGLYLDRPVLRPWVAGVEGQVQAGDGAAFLRLIRRQAQQGAASPGAGAKEAGQ